MFDHAGGVFVRAEKSRIPSTPCAAERATDLMYWIGGILLESSQRLGRFIKYTTLPPFDLASEATKSLATPGEFHLRYILDRMH